MYDCMHLDIYVETYLNEYVLGRQLCYRYFTGSLKFVSHLHTYAYIYSKYLLKMASPSHLSVQRNY